MLKEKLYSIRGLLFSTRTPPRRLGDTMAKQNASDRPDPSPVGSHGLLRGLVEAVHHLIAMISARLSRSRIHQSPMGNAKGEYDIWKKIGNHVERISADTKPEGESRRNRSVKSSYPKRTRTLPWRRTI